MPPSNEEALLALAVSKPGAERAAWLDRECGGDQALRARLEVRLAAHETSAGVPGEEPAAPILAPTLDLPEPPPDEAVGTTLGRYKLREKLGEGGCGVVYVAEQTEPVQRRVALKVIKLGMDTREVIARFEAERQALAMMDHPNIAKVFDAGTTNSGRPYFVMELVRGICITDYCDQAQLSTKERLGLFIKVCQAIQHAHQKGIIHRDIKPSNILVTLHDGLPVPKVIDFGIAKATEGRLTDATVYTQLHQFMGTPAYMSPEQAEMSGLDIDTRSDIYSLGVLLYQLLTSQTPFDGKELLSMGVDAMRRTIREKEPLRPSTRVATLLGEELTTTAKRRAIDAPKLIHLLKGDLDWIVMKALEKDRTRRYDTANGLAQDIVRHLGNEPVVARPPSTVYRLQKLARRNRVAFAATGVVAAALIFGVFISTWQAVRATRAEREKAGLLATANEAKASEEEQRRLAERNAAQAQAAVTRLEIDRAEMLFDDGQSAEALAYLARVVRREPTNRVAGERILSALAHRNLCVPLFRLEHKTNVTSAEFSPDGLRVLTASKDGKAQLWDGRTGLPLLGPFQHAGEVTAAHFSPDGSRVVTVSLDRTARIWDAQTGQPVTAPLQHEAGVLCADFSQDGQRVVTGSTNGSMGVWSATTGAPLGTTATLEGGVNFVKFSPDGRWIALASTSSESGRILNSADGKVAASFEQNDPGVSHAAFPLFSPDGTRVLATGQPGTVKIIWLGNASSNRVARSLHANSITGAQFSPDGQTLVTCSLDCKAIIRYADTFQPVGEEIRHENWVNAVEFSRDGQQVVTAAKDRTARIWDARTGRPLCEPLRHDANVLAVQFSADGQRVLSRCDGPGVWVWEVRRGQPLTAALEHPWPVRRAVFSPDGERVATATRGTGDADDIVRLWDARQAVPMPPLLGQGRAKSSGDGVFDVQFSRDGHLLLAVDWYAGTTVWDSMTGKIVGGPFRDPYTTNSTQNSARTARFSPDGHLVVAAGEGDQVRVWHIVSGSLVASFSHEAKRGFARFSPDGRWVVTTSTDTTARLWDWRTGKPLTEPLHHGGAVVGADVSADSQRVATVSRDQTARIWEANSGKLLHTLPHAEEPYNHNSVQFSPDGRMVVTASGSAVQVWNAHTGQPITAPMKHDGRVSSVRFSPDGRRLATACQDGAARLWDAATGHSVSEPLRHRRQVEYAEFSPDGRWVLTASQDRTARIWEVPALSSVPPWLADWAEAVAGQRIDEGNANQSVPFDEVRRLRERVAQAPDGDETARWARWFFAENTTRTISPASSLTVARWVQQRTEHYTLESLRQAVQVSPTHGVAQARLAYLMLTSESRPAPRPVASLEWHSRRGVELSPNEPDAWRARAKFCEHLGRLPEAIDAMNRATGLSPTNATLWHRKGLLLEKTHRLEEALQAYSKAIEFSGPWEDTQTLPAMAHESRCKLNRRLNRLPEAAADNLKVFNLPGRDPRTLAALIDLSLYYNHRIGAELTLQPGLHTLAGGSQFDIRGSIGAGWERPGQSTGEDIGGISIGQKCRRLHFLHVGWDKVQEEGTEVGVYRLHYADGQLKEIPIIYGAHLRYPGDSKEALAMNTKVAWAGVTPDKTPMQLFETTWENERPEVTIESFDFIPGGPGQRHSSSLSRRSLDSARR